MATSDGASSIAVTVRVRPFTIREAAQLTKCDDGPIFLGDGSLAAAPTPKLMQKGIRPVIKVIDDKCLVFDPPEDSPVQRFSKSVVPSSGKRVKDQTFAFDRVFDENTSQGDVFEATTRGLLDSVLDGYNATVFAYGATGCGKTHTITGTAQDPGIIFLAMQELFERIGERRPDKETEVSLSYLEIYNETIRDLLVPGGSKGGLMLREDANQSVSVAGLSSHNPQSVQEVMDMIMKGNEYRTMSPTEANATSSRSHAVLQINISQRDRNADVNEPHTMATLSIIDLAGSERASATKNRGERLLEGANINKSLLALGSCINALCDPRKKNHVPYRNSKLTRLLKFSLGGNCKTVMIVCVSPSSHHFDETQNTLRYANRAKNIQTKVTRNVFNVNRHVKDFLKKIDEQLGMINELKQQQKDYEVIAFAKFKKLDEKHDVVSREGIGRIRSAFEHSLPERKERIGHMRKLRHIERRIAMISSWMTAFDTICAAREDERTRDNLIATRRTAQGVLLELESSRQHYHQRIAKLNWERAIESALQMGIRQLRELSNTPDESHLGNLTRETELVKAQADRETSSALLEQDKMAEAATVQVLLEAHFETIGLVNQVLHMDEAQAVHAARTILQKILTTCSDATNHMIHPDGQSVTDESFPPRHGTPKRRKPNHLPGPSPMAMMTTARSMDPALSMASQLRSTPVKASPRKRKVVLVKKNVTFTPKKKTPSKRGVRWKDDVENGSLTEFAKTPQRLDFTPDNDPPAHQLPLHLPPSPRTTESTVTAPMPLDSTITPADTSNLESPSPMPAKPVASFDVRAAKNSRFLTGFLSKKSEGSPPPPSMTPLPASDSEHSPLRDLAPSKASNRSALHRSVTAMGDESSVHENGNHSSSETEQTTMRIRRSDAIAIRSAMKRASSISGSSSSGSSGNGNRRPRQRRRSPGGGASSCSPPNDLAMFTASHARRMVKGDKENLNNVLSPRTTPVIKNVRRTTVSESRHSSSGIAGREAVRIGGTGSGSGSRGRDSSGKGVWR